MHRYLSNWLARKLFDSRSQTGITCCRPKLCDVFINHRGMDTKHNIAGLLYDRLVHLKLHPFLDHKTMKPGDELIQNIESAIWDSKIGVAIFSPHYCRSYFCLHELALMMEYEKKIVPIFYDVKPSDLMVVDDGSYTSKDLHRFRSALELAKHRVGLSFDSFNGDWSHLLKRASDSVVEILMEIEAREKELPTPVETDLFRVQPLVRNKA